MFISISLCIHTQAVPHESHEYLRNEKWFLIRRQERSSISKSASRHFQVPETFFNTGLETDFGIFKCVHNSPVPQCLEFMEQEVVKRFLRICMDLAGDLYQALFVPKWCNFCNKYLFGKWFSNPTVCDERKCLYGVRHELNRITLWKPFVLPYLLNFMFQSQSYALGWEVMHINCSVIEVCVISSSTQDDFFKSVFMTLYW